MKYEKSLLLQIKRAVWVESAIICQYAHYLNSLGFACISSLISDHQKNTTKAFITGGAATVSGTVSAFDMLTKEIKLFQILKPFNLWYKQHQNSTAIEKNGTLHNNFATNYQKFLKSVDSLFDVCLIDTNPNPDTRQVASLIVSD